ncbi:MULTISPECIES: protein translocase subunit SecF [Microbacterium]|uniref:Protein-export membrane protein SecF n=1 Tax=Microbacterium barkeri TaxID=33917 RepID=A0A9W6H0F3_9MICO|nr:MULTISPECIES: protein translocase subunit SecF [Microbacterium]MDI6942045.1 protein translocase subunit SecF [Microbacterium barkeri]MDR6875918.1 preprotein translocase subunit SecF [Microbacterium barkeri]WRH17551.1 protein translocase subunit SecF [Microbacterium sp. JZ37]GLJ60036.1 protein-export membrane protein SecF [Microbacterium barkeri]
MRSMAQWGNDLYTGKASVPFVGRRRTWFILAIALIALSVLAPFVRGVELSIEFTGGSQYTVSAPSSTDQSIATEAVHSVVPDAEAKVTVVGGADIRVQTSQMSQDETREVSAALAEGYGVDQAEVTDSFIGPTWGADVTRQSLWGLGVFLLLTFVILAIYFRTWKMSVAAIIGLVDVLVITIGIYSLAGFAISPAAVIGFLTILGYSLYDTTVVFDKIRENTAEDGEISGRTFGESVNLGVNQTLIRSINTSIVAALPVAAILFIGVFWLGAETLSDISLSIFVGIIVATYSTLFVSAPLYSLMREKEPAIAQRDARVLEARA